MHLLLRPLLSFIVLVVLAIAVLEVFGRAAVALLPHAEPMLNLLLSPRGVQLRGVEGEWRHLNPVLKVQRVELNAGRLDDVHAELDLIESLIRGHVVVFRARVQDGALRLRKTGSGPWRLADMPGGDGFDPLPLIERADQLQFSGTVSLQRDQGAPSALAVSWIGTHREGLSRHRVHLANLDQDCSAPRCEASFDIARRAGWTRAVPDLQLTVKASGFVVPAPLLGRGRLALDELDLGWDGASPQARGGWLAARVRGALDAGDPGFSAAVSGSARGDQAQQWGSIDSLLVTHGEQRLALQPIRVLRNRDGVHAALDSLDLPSTVALLESAARNSEPLRRWLQALAPAAIVSDIRLVYPFATRALGYRFDVRDLALDGYKGVPYLRHASGRVTGVTPPLDGGSLADAGHRLQLDVAADDFRIGFPDLLSDVFDVTRAVGQIRAYVRRETVSLRAPALDVRFADVHATGGLAISRMGPDERDRRLAALVAVDAIDVPTARRLVPLKLPPKLYEFLTGAPMDGEIRGGRLAYQGQFRAAPDDRGRRLEIAGEFNNARLKFHPDWPEVTAASGYLEVAGREVRVRADAARALGAVLDGSRVTLRDNAGVADLQLRASADATSAFDLVRSSPLAGWMPFVAPDWSGRGPATIEGALTIPLRTVDTADAPATSERLEVALTSELSGVDLSMPGYRLEFIDLRGQARYRYPDTIAASALNGQLFGAPSTVSVRAENDRFLFDVVGTAGSADVWRVGALPDLGILRGSARFRATLDLPAPRRRDDARAPAAPARLSVRSDLEGMTVRLPGAYAKLAEEPTAFALELLLDDERRLTFDYRDLAGWLAFLPAETQPKPAQKGAASGLAAEYALARGSIGMGARPMPVETSAREVLVTGRLGELDPRALLAEWQDDGLDDLLYPEATDNAPAPMTLPPLPRFPVPVRLQAFEVETLLLGGLVTRNALLEADLVEAGLDTRLESDRLDARLRWQRTASADRPALTVDVDDLWLERGSGRDDPLSPALIRSVPPARVTIRQMTVGDADYGRWSFRLVPEGADLRVTDIEAELRKVAIASSDGLVWRGDNNVTEFAGTLSMGNLAEVLPLWGYAPNVASKRAQVDGVVSWPGSPAAFSLAALRGVAAVSADDGRFLEVAAGGGTQRILSLLNFTTIAKRMSLDFSDVFGRGLSFDELRAELGFETGTLRFLKPLSVEGTGIKLRMTGTVQLAERALDHEMVVTLPVNRSLPWYAAYLGLANPIAGLGVLVGERVLRKPLETFSSARYRVTGTVENPRVQLLSVFATDSEERAVEVPVGAPDTNPVGTEAEDSATKTSAERRNS
ncbi:MAG: YhdP family protein [Pseudomonadales bacterium]